MTLSLRPNSEALRPLLRSQRSQMTSRPPEGILAEPRPAVGRKTTGPGRSYHFAPRPSSPFVRAAGTCSFNEAYSREDPYHPVLWDDPGPVAHFSRLGARLGYPAVAPRQSGSVLGPGTVAPLERSPLPVAHRGRESSHTGLFPDQ